MCCEITLCVSRCVECVDVTDTDSKVVASKRRNRFDGKTKLIVVRRHRVVRFSKSFSWALVLSTTPSIFGWMNYDANIVCFESEQFMRVMWIRSPVDRERDIFLQSKIINGWGRVGKNLRVSLKSLFMSMLKSNSSSGSIESFSIALKSDEVFWKKIGRKNNSSTLAFISIVIASHWHTYRIILQFLIHFVTTGSTNITIMTWIG